MQVCLRERLRPSYWLSLLSPGFPELQIQSENAEQKPALGAWIGGSQLSPLKGICQISCCPKLERLELQPLLITSQRKP